MDEEGRAWIEMVEAEDARTGRAQRGTRLMRRLVPGLIVVGMWLIGWHMLIYGAGALFSIWWYSRSRPEARKSPPPLPPPSGAP